MDANLVRRVGFAVVAIPLALLLVWYGGLPLVVLLAAAAALGAARAVRPGRAPADPARPGARPRRARPRSRRSPMPTIAAPDVRAVVAAAWPYAAAVWLIGVLTWALVARAPAERPLAAVGGDRAGRGVHGRAAGLPARHAAPRRTAAASWAGAWLVFFPLVVTWVCDTAAMFGGRAIGGPKLAPTVSPGKTRSGSLAGVVGGLAGGAALRRRGVSPGRRGGAALAARGHRGGARRGGQVGDLAESLFKREAGVKDSSHLIPGPRRRARPARLALFRGAGGRGHVPAVRGRRDRGGERQGARRRGARLDRLDRAEHAGRPAPPARAFPGRGAHRRPEREEFEAQVAEWRPAYAGARVPAATGRATPPGRRCCSRPPPIPTWTSWSTRWSAPPGSTPRWRRSGRGSGSRWPTRKRW